MLFHRILIDETDGPAVMPKMRNALVTVTDSFDGFVPRTASSYWHDLQDGGGAPEWSRVRLVDLYKIVRFVAVKDAVDGGREFTNRYWGTGLVDFFGLEATGLTVAEYYNGDDIADVLELMRFVLRQDGPVRVEGRAVYVRDRHHRPFELGLFPMSGDDGAPKHILMAYQFDLTDKG